jgi:hypothetical protein
MSRLVSASILAAVAAAVALPTAALATTFSEALGICKRNPKCSYQGNGLFTTEQGGVVLCDKGKKGKCTVVTQPQ